MNPHHRLSILGCSLAFAFSAVAADEPTGTQLVVKVFPDHYVSGGARFFDIKGLEASVGAGAPRSVRLETCGPASANHLVAAVARLHRVHAEELDIRALAIDDPVCSNSAHYATDRYGRSIMP